MRQNRTSSEQSERGGEPTRGPLTLRLYPDSVLRTHCEPVDRFDAWLADVFDEMLVLMRNHRGIGLAGPQAGLTKKLFVAELEGHTLCLANPLIYARGGRDRMVEGCLSLPGMQVELDRAFQVELHGYDVRGVKQEYRLEGLWARVVQHETDHLDGVLICDRQESTACRNTEAQES